LLAARIQVNVRNMFLLLFSSEPAFTYIERDCGVEEKRKEFAE